jgi:hypothetical protein
MTAFRNTIFGRVLGGVGKVASVVAPIVVPAVGAGVLVAAAAKTGLFSKIGNIFKKKEGGTVLGNALGKTASEVIKSSAAIIGENVGSTAHAILTNGPPAEEGSAKESFNKGAKRGFLADLWETKKGIVIGAIVALGIIIFLIFNKRKNYGRR